MLLLLPYPGTDFPGSSTPGDLGSWSLGLPTDGEKRIAFYDV
jgi:hypothetical protein